jgi:peptidoglycan-associated lipoprotein
MSGQRLVAQTLVVMVLAFGCAKQPSMTSAAAPAPTGAAGTSKPDTRPAGPAPDRLQPASQRGGTGSGGPTAGPARPAPSEFAPTSELTDIHFDFDRYEIRPGDAQILDADAAWLKTNARHLLLIEGHCDERGTNEYNLALGERRAKATMNYLASRGVAATRMTIVSYGEERPQCTEHTEACWAKNRRAHFLVKRD